MLDSPYIIFAVSVLLAFLSGLGVGGGSLLVLWLTLVLGYQHTDARVINLLFFLPCACISTFWRWKQGLLDFKTVLPAILIGCLAAGLGTFFSNFLDTGLLKKLFGGLLILTGIRELRCRRSKKEHP